MSARRTIAEAAEADECGHTAGTVPAQSLAAPGRRGRSLDGQSCAPLPGWPRLMPLGMACRYVGLSPDTLLGYVHDGSLRVTRPLRPNTARAHGYRYGKSRRTVAQVETLRRMLFDRVDLDALVDRWKREGAA